MIRFLVVDDKIVIHEVLSECLRGARQGAR